MEIRDRQKEAFAKLFSNITIPDDLKSLDDDTLMETRRTLWLVMDNLVQASDIEKRELTPDESLAYDYAESRITRIDHERRKRDDNRPQRLGFGSVKITSSEKDEERASSGAVGLSYRDMFFNSSRGDLDDGGFRNAREFYEIVASGKFDPRLNTRTMSGDLGSLGGVAIPSNLSERIFSVAMEDSIVLPRATIFPIKYGRSISIPIFDGFNNATGLFGNFNGQWLGEEQTATPQDATLASVEMEAKKLAIFLNASNEVISDSMTLATALEGAMQKAVAFILDESFLGPAGNGVAKPISAINDHSTIKVNRAAANAISLTDLTSIYSRLAPQCQKKAVWVVSPSTIPQLCAMTSGGHPVFVINASQGVPGSIFGLPILVSEKLAELGTTGDIMLADFSNYAICLRREISIERSNAPLWSQDIMSYRCICRANGRSMWKEALTPRNGGSTLSWCVVLD